MAQATQQEANGFEWAVRHAVYQQFASSGNAPAVAELADKLKQPASVIEDALQWLQDQHHALFLAPGTSNVWMAGPFSAIPTLYPVNTADRIYWANCAWEALSIPTLVGLDATTKYYCPDCNTQLTLTIKDGELAPTDAIVHFAVPPNRFFDNLAFT